LVCLDLSGKEVWNSGRDKFGSAPYMVAGGLIYAMNDDGVLTLAETTPQAYRPLARAEVIEGGVDSWGPLALVAGRLIARDMTRMVCLDVAEK
jgi:outer membrane protein assembly factor BamB